MRIRAAKNRSVIPMCSLIVCLVTAASSAHATDEISPSAVERAHTFLKVQHRGQFILKYAHAGLQYNGHSFRSNGHVTTPSGARIPGHFWLTYRFQWGNDGGWTDVTFFCDPAGSVYDLQVEDTNAVVNQPFLGADVTLVVLGNVLLEAFKDEMNEQDRKAVKRLVDNTDSKGLLKLALRIQQSVGR